jgi:8-oxo-dGTP pyrophosphatase MutT (NUDIX family)
LEKSFLSKESKEKMCNSEDSQLAWTQIQQKKLLTTAVLTVNQITSRSPKGDEHDYVIIDAPSWVTVVPVIKNDSHEQFIMVRQWRHAEKRMSVEFPGGVINPGETPAQGAARELLEETGYTAKRLVPLASFSPNPALMTNRQHFFLAFDLTDTGKLHLDEDEYMQVIIEDAESVYRHMENGEYSHGLMVCGAFLYQRYTATAT